MKIKYITFKAVALGAIMLFTACSDEFFSTSPATQVTTEEVYTSEANADAVVNAAIRYLLERTDIQGTPGLPTIFMTHDVMCEDAFSRQNRYGVREAYNFTDPLNNNNNTTKAKFMWGLQYTTISYTNSVIANTDETLNEKYAHIKGQAYALRAFNYLNLVRQYQFTYATSKTAKAVPIYTEPTTPTTEPKVRSSVEEVYNQVIADLTKAESLLVGFERKVKNRPNINVVQGLFARTYLTQENWAKAAEYAAKARVGYPLMDPANYEGFNDVENSEWIWGHPQTATQNRGSYSYFGYIETTPYDVDAAGVPIYYGYNSIVPDPNFVALFEDGDARKDLFEIATHPSEALYQLYRYRKFRNKYPNHDGHILLMRSSEMLLIEAESKARLNDVPAAIALLNELRAKRNLSALNTGDFTQATAIAEVLLERRKELWGEGFRLYDVLRTQTPPVRKEATGSFVNTKGETAAIKGHYVLAFPDGTPINGTAETLKAQYFLFPIPLTEIQNNPNLDNY
jgi:hypothetical protein